LASKPSRGARARASLAETLEIEVIVLLTSIIVFRVISTLVSSAGNTAPGTRSEVRDESTRVWGGLRSGVRKTVSNFTSRSSWGARFSMTALRLPESIKPSDSSLSAKAVRVADPQHD
jgi:hypothetical protein